MKIYVGNLSDTITDDELKTAFEVYGKTDSVNVIKDKFSGAPRGFGFVEMSNNKEAKAAVDGLSGTELKGKNLIVNEARERPDKNRGGSRRY